MNSQQEPVVKSESKPLSLLSSAGKNHLGPGFAVSVDA